MWAAVPRDSAAAYVIGLALPQALAHAAPDVPPERYPELGQRYRYHYMQHQDDLSLFDGVLPLMERAARARPSAGGRHRQKPSRGLDEALRMR
jgi:phosphoglycolate phosphatase